MWARTMADMIYGFVPATKNKNMLSWILDIYIEFFFTQIKENKYS